MIHTVIRITPFGSFDIPGLERWLGSMSAKGLRFSMTIGPLTCFERTDMDPLQIHLEPIQGNPDEDPELNAIYEESGWQYWGIFRNNFYVYASPDLEAQAHTDPATLDYALNKFFRHKLVEGVLLLVANLLLLGLYWQGSPWEIDLLWLRYYPVETLSNGKTIPFLLAALGFLLLDLSYLLGLFHLMHYRRAMQHGGPVGGQPGVGWLLAAGWLLLLPVLINTVQLFSRADYRPYDLEGSGFVTLTDMEGDDFRLSGTPMYNPDHISHGGTLLDPEYWSFRQYGSFGPDQSPYDVPHLELSIVRYPLEELAQLRAEEWSRQEINGSGEYEKLTAEYGLDDIYYAQREKRIHTNEITGEFHAFLPGGIFILRRENTVLFADYYGHQDLTGHLDKFAAMLENL